MTSFRPAVIEFKAYTAITVGRFWEQSSNTTWTFAVRLPGLAFGSLVQTSRCEMFNEGVRFFEYWMAGIVEARASF